jgi:hypothetical protein
MIYLDTSTLGINQRTGQLTEAKGQGAWQRFERLCANDLQLLPVEPATFHRAALLSLDAANDPVRRESFFLASYPLLG